ncbi:hypothetical protein Tco_0758187 [Tanacetum coccineum]
MDNSHECRDMMANLFTLADDKFFNEGVRDESAIKRSWKLLCQSAQQQANTLLCFKALKEQHADLIYAHEMNWPQFDQPMMRKLEEVEEEKNEVDNLNSSQPDRIRKLKEALKQAEADVEQLRAEKAILKVTLNVDPASSETFLTAYEKIFDQWRPYVDKVARMYLLDPSEL